jgi:hypothetical protein
MSRKTITGADATRMPGIMPKLNARRRKINPPQPRVIKGRGWVA